MLPITLFVYQIANLAIRMDNFLNLTFQVASNVFQRLIFLCRFCTRQYTRDSAGMFAACVNVLGNGVDMSHSNIL